VSDLTTERVAHSAMVGALALANPGTELPDWFREAALGYGMRPIAEPVTRAVLADLEDRYILIPREGVTVRTDWGIQMPTTGRVFTEIREPDWDLKHGQVKVSRTHIVGAWEAQS
jgi:hypothetical protein